MTNKERAERLQHIASAEGFNTQNRRELIRIANELYPPRPEPGTADIDTRIRQAYWSGFSDAMYKRDRDCDRLREALAEANQLLIRYLSPKLPSSHETLELVTKIATLQEAGDE